MKEVNDRLAFFMLIMDYIPNYNNMAFVKIRGFFFSTDIYWL